MIAKTKFLLLQKILKYFMHAKFNILNEQHTHSNLSMKSKNSINDTQLNVFQLNIIRCNPKYATVSLDLC